MELLLRFPEPRDEAVCRRLHAQLASEGFEFLLKRGTWAEICDAIRQEHEGIDLAAGRVPSSWMVAVVQGEVVGRVSIRHTLTERLLHEGGHIGYAVAPEHRRRGYATEMLRQSVDILAARGTERVLVTCDDTNAASAGVIERCGGVLEDVRIAANGTPKRRYWIIAAAQPGPSHASSR